MNADAVIIGAGIHGCSVALQLARAGLSTIVLEQAHAGRHASGVNAGGVRRLGRHLAEIPLSLKSMEIWHDIRALVDDDCGFEVSGQLKVAENEAELDQLGNRVAELEKLGYRHEKLISREDLRDLLPSASRHCCGAIYCAEDGHAKPFRTVSAFATAARKAGARFYFGEAVTQLGRESGVWKISTESRRFQSPIVINAAGAWGAILAAKMGQNIPLQPTALMLMISERMKPFCKPVVGAAGRTLSFKQFSNGTVLIGGGLKGHVDFAGQHAHIDIRQLAVNAETARSIFPIMENARIVRCWAGIEGFTPDGIPVIGQGENDGVYHLFGFSAHGFQLGPVTGEIIRDLILTGASKLPIDSFSAGRFG